MQNLNLIRESRIYTISEKILELPHIRELAVIIWGEYQKFKILDSETEIGFSVKCFDRSHYQSSNISIFDDHSIINKKRIKSVSISLTGRHSISLHIRHGNSLESTFDVSGDDNMWVNGVTGKLNESLDGIPDQKSYLQQSGSQIGMAFFIFIVLTIVVTKALDILNRGDSDYSSFWSISIIPNVHSWSIAGFITWGILGGILAIGIVGKIQEYAKKLWPSIELQIGPEHKRSEKRQRDFYFLLTSVIIIPLLMSLLMEFIF